MSAPAEICDACAKTITDEELETGAAISVLGKSYCPACKSQAVKEISLEDLATPAAATRLPPPVLKPPPKLPPPPSEAATVKVPPPPPRAERLKEAAATPRTPAKPATRRIALASAKSGPSPALLGGIAVAVAVAIAGIFFFMRGESGGGAPKKPSDTTDPASGPAPKKPPVDPAAARQDKAEQAYLKTVLLSRQPGTGSAELLAAIDRAAPDCAGTPFEAKLEELRAQAARGKEAAEAVRRLDAIVAELKTAAPADTKFARYAELTEKYLKAKEIAVASAPERLPELNQIRQDYAARYEKAAEPHVQDIEQTAKVLADERRYDDALAKIETFPRELRQSGAWRGLELLRQDIERRKKLFPPKK